MVRIPLCTLKYLCANQLQLCAKFCRYFSFSHYQDKQRWHIWELFVSTVHCSHASLYVPVLVIHCKDIFFSIFILRFGKLASLAVLYWKTIIFCLFFSALQTYLATVWLRTDINANRWCQLEITIIYKWIEEFLLNHISGHLHFYIGHEYKKACCHRIGFFSRKQQDFLYFEALVRSSSGPCSKFHL